MNWWATGAAIGATTLLGVAWWWSRRLSPTKRGIKQFARDRDAMRRTSKYFEDRDRMLAEAPRFTQEQIDGLVEALLEADEEGRSMLARVLEAVGIRAETALLRAMDDPRCDESQKGESWRDRPVYEVVTGLLAGFGSPALLPRMLPVVRNGTKEQRKHAALCVASIGSDGAIAPTIGALADAEEYVRSHAMMGIGRSVDAGRATPAFRDAAFAALAHIVTGEAGFSSFQEREAPGFLAAIDRERALGVLTSKACVSESNPLLASILEQLNKEQFSIDPPTLLRLLHRAKDTDKYPWEYVRTACLRMLVRVEPSLAAKEIDEALRDPKKQARKNAAEILREMEGLGDGGRLPFSLDLDSVSKPVGHVIAAWHFQAEVNNGGISQYFFNPSGDQWPRALEAFEDIGARVCAEILRSSLTVLGAKGPSLDRGKRIRQYARLSDEKEKALDALSSTFYKDEDELDVLITRYMIRHADVFKAAIKAHVRTNAGGDG